MYIEALIKLNFFRTVKRCSKPYNHLLMQKLLLLTLLLTLSVKNYAQSEPDKNLDVKDSLEIMRDLINILSDSSKPYSYLAFDLGIGNRVFNVRNNVLKSKLSPVSTIIYSPSINYHHKSGLFFSAGVNLLNDPAKGFGSSQHSISSGYELSDNDKVDLIFEYTHYFVKNNFSPYSSPIQNDFYGAFTYKKAWMRPGIALGYSTGNYGDVKRLQRLYDSTTNKLTSFSFIASVAHQFDWEKVFNKSDGLIFTPSILLSSGSSKIAIHHNTNATNLANLLNRKGRLPKFSNTKFEIQSLGLSLDLSYGIGKFTFEPQAYFDYYLPATDANRTSSYFTFTIRYLLQ